MGSLMAGWDSQIKDPKSAKLMRNMSLTKDEIDTYWKKKKKTEDDHLKSISPASSPTGTNISCERSIMSSTDPGNDLEISKTPKYTRSSSLPNNLERKSDDYSHDEAQKFTKANTCWWTSSNWAFLNEPPVIAGEVPKFKYASQYHVANMDSSAKQTDTRITGV